MALAVIDEDAEHERAAFWRRRIVLLKPERLAELTGYNWGTIYRFERGQNSAGDGPPPADAWRCYKMACAGVHARLHGWTKGRQFDWKL